MLWSSDQEFPKGKTPFGGLALEDEELIGKEDKNKHGQRWEEQLQR